MEYFLLIARSVTHAQHMARVLDGCGIRSGIIRAPAGLTSSGCSYALRIRAGQWAAARECLDRSGLRPVSVWSGQGSGYREVSI